MYNASHPFPIFISVPHQGLYFLQSQTAGEATVCAQNTQKFCWQGVPNTDLAYPSLGPTRLGGGIPHGSILAPQAFVDLFLHFARAAFQLPVGWKGWQWKVGDCQKLKYLQMVMPKITPMHQIFWNLVGLGFREVNMSINSNRYIDHFAVQQKKCQSRRYSRGSVTPMSPERMGRTLKLRKCCTNAVPQIRKSGPTRQVSCDGFSYSTPASFLFSLPNKKQRINNV